MTEINYKHLGIRIRKRRMELNLTQASLAEQTNLCVSYISYLETGKKIPSLPCLVSIAEILDTTLDYLVTGTPPPSLQDNHLLNTVLSDCSPQEQDFLVSLVVVSKELLRQHVHAIYP